MFMAKHLHDLHHGIDKRHTNEETSTASSEPPQYSTVKIKTLHIMDAVGIRCPKNFKKDPNGVCQQEE
ncbi:hypothetical protein NQ315_011417 [Exocentrus adspersus]|uniref:Uncharacterized protein n=1 Tax=Exocentrus adspersus TaxID=1586481 RepID=A0AAV8V5N1_9CUCU|nr:hypothetical protein NQ315_011417 [Exocentrus adspersus]